MSELEVHPDDLSQAAGVLTSAGSALFGHARDLETTPDAGRSTDEVAQALVSLATAVAGLAEQLGQLADRTEATGALFTGTDQDVGSRFDASWGPVAP